MRIFENILTIRRAAMPILAGLLLTACSWKPRVVNPDLFDTARPMAAGKVEAGAQWPTAGQVRVGLGQGFEAKALGGWTGENIYGGELSLSKSLVSRGPTYAELSVGYGAMEADGHPFHANRAHVGFTTSFFTRNERFALHLPFKVYWTRYDWTDLEPRQRRYVADGVVFVPGIGASVQGRHWAVRAGLNAPTREHLDQLEFEPAFGAQVALRF